MIDLSTQYLGLKLRNPLVVAASPLVQGDLEPAPHGGLPAPPPSSSTRSSRSRSTSSPTNSTAFSGTAPKSAPRAPPSFPISQNYNIGPDAYLEHIRHAKQSVSIPVIASLNGVSRGGWVSYAREMQQAGADAIELNVYFIPADPASSSERDRKALSRPGRRKSAIPSPSRSR